MDNMMDFVKLQDLPPDTYLIPGGFTEMKHIFWLNKDQRADDSNQSPCVKVDLPTGKTFDFKTTFSINSEDIAAMNVITSSMMEDITRIEDAGIMEALDEEDFELPSYSDRGSITVWVGPQVGLKQDREYVILECDTGSCVFWINEGVGVDYWLDEHCQFPNEGGVFVVENITGTVYGGNGWDTDSDEEWDYERVRPATLFEIDFEKGQLEEFLMETEISNLV